MMEWMEKYNDAPRSQTSRSIDRPMVLFMGLTVSDLILGALTFMAIVKLWDSGLAILVSVLAAFLVASAHKAVREKLPPLYFYHLQYALGFLRPKGIPQVIKSPFKGENLYGP